MLCIARVGAPWRDLPEPFGNWHSTFKRFRRWVEKEVFAHLFSVNDGLRKEIDARGFIAVIPPKANRKTAIPCEFHMYRWRDLIENFCDLKKCLRIATRYDKTDESFAAMIHLAAAVMALR